MKIHAVIVFLFFLNTMVFGTPQIPDKIIYKGDIRFLDSNPFEYYFKKFPDKRPHSEIQSSGLWRDYVATFEILNNQLFLIDIEILVPDPTDKNGFRTSLKSVFKEIFPKEKRITIDWVTGLLAIFKERKVYSQDSASDFCILMEIKNCNLLKERKYNQKQYEDFKKKQFEAFKKTKEYKNIKEKMKRDNKDYTEESIDSFLRSSIIRYSSKILVEEN